ncbi:MAG: nucleotidyl transferase AbiEii/AbiGii toxin family protein [Prevotellaceae bacterium]|jgi:predicted nucleotidyltransferase component of viral defense system|nr:nucleotidyl transferase AbiEii/AbiGii toxin family protein [Prevotellaceae bacterium]
MIEQKEINRIASQNRVSDRQIEKDYVISWLLFAISKNERLYNALVFKGGTVLKKAYFEDYRFSEDLDFTLFDNTVSNEFVFLSFNNLFEYIKEEANIDMRIDPSKWKIHESGSPQFYIDYVASLQGSMGSRDLKIDITRGEVLETKSETKAIFRTYSDLNEVYYLQCYSLAEILIEKMIALMSRTEPRDLYDFWYLTEIERINVVDFLIEFRNKAFHKKQDPNKFIEKVLSKEAAFKRDWEKKLASQIHDLPKYEEVFRGAKRFFYLLLRHKDNRSYCQNRIM